jgi:predicted DNA binding CopG/RHH family protein
MAARRRRSGSKDKEREFWSVQDSTALVDWSKAEKTTLPNLKPSLKTISLRLPAFILDELKRLAHKRDVPYQSLIKMFLAERVQRELQDDPARD